MRIEQLLTDEELTARNEQMKSEEEERLAELGKKVMVAPTAISADTQYPIFR